MSVSELLKSVGNDCPISWRVASVSLVYALIISPCACVSKNLIGSVCIFANISVRRRYNIPCVTDAIKHFVRDGNEGFDFVLVEIGGTVKNVIAIAVGCSDGMGFGDNTRAALITRGLAELKRLVLAYGGRSETLSGLAGIGDLIVTCTSVHSRNHSVGERLGKGEKIGDILSSMQMVAEGVWNSKVVHELARDLGVEMPICDLVYALCYEDFDARKAVKSMMDRELKSE